jgi:hypothetical protein
MPKKLKPNDSVIAEGQKARMEAPQTSLPMPSQATIDANSTKGRMGEGKPPSPIKAGKKLYEGMKNIVKDSMARTIQTKEQNKENYKKSKIK